MARWIAFACLIACSHGDRGRAERTTQVAACADAIEKAAAAPVGEQAEVIARGCPAACPGLPAWATARDSAELRPGVWTDRPGAAAPRDALAACVAPDHPASEEEAVLDVVARWLERAEHDGLADPQLAVRLEHLAATGSFVLPLPAQPGLPGTGYRSASHARQFVTVGEPLRIGAVPHVRLRAGRLEPVSVPGATPGQPVDLDDIGAALIEHGDVLGQIVGAPPAPPIVLAPATTPYARLLDVLTRTGAAQAELAVAGDVAYAHPVLLERRGMRVATPEIDLEPGDIRLRGFGDDRVTDWDHLAGELDNFTAVNAPVRALELHPLPDTTVADLARILDACVVARVSVIQFIPPPAP